MKQTLNKILLQATLAIITVVTAVAQDYSGYTQCAEQDSLALVAFFNATDGPNWKSQQDGFSIDNLGDDVKTYYTTDYPNAGMGKWLEGPVKDWFGILLEKQQIGNTSDSVWRVIHLRATVDRRSSGDNNLKGYIPKEVGLLTALKWFKVNGNSGLGEKDIPDEIYHSTLEQFDIESVNFTGIISSAFRNCANLSYINLRYNKLDSIPTFDFLSEEHLTEAFANTGQTIWFYNNQLSYATLEPTIKYFRSVSGDIEYEARYQNNIGREKEIVIADGESVTLSSDDAGDEGAYYGWQRNGNDTYKNGSTYTTSQTGDYKVRVENNYIRSNDENQDYPYVYTKLIHVVNEPEIPTCSSINTSYSGREVTLEFSKPMAVPTTSQASEFTVTSGATSISAINIVRTGWLKNKLVLTLESPVEKGMTVSVSYAKGSIVCENGGELASFTNIEAANFTREKPNLLTAKTTSSGESIILTFDKFIDENSLDISDFTPYVDGIGEIPIYDIALINGECNDNISKQIEIILDKTLDQGQDISISYTPGSMMALYGGMSDAITNFSVENSIDPARIAFTISFIDGTKELGNIVVKEVKRKPIELSDDATHGDKTADDHTWSYTFSVPAGKYEWEVYSRTYAYDTIVSNDTIKLVKNKKNYTDVLINTDTLLSITLSSEDIVGDSVYEYYNYAVTFFLDLSEYAKENPDALLEPYLMGIDNDWTEGIEMDALTNTMYTTQITQKHWKDKLSFNFRNGEEWENNSPKYRTHTVFGNDTINTTFGYKTTTNIENPEKETRIMIHPTLATDYLYVKSGSYTLKQIKIFSLTGTCKLSMKYCGSPIDLTGLQPGSYLIEISTTKDHVLHQQFIKL